MTHWFQVPRTDKRARELADRHYSRQTIGATEFCRAGENIVLIIPSQNHLSAEALWVSHRAAPNFLPEHPRADGFDYWDNTYFRNESKFKGSELIYEALAITRYLWTNENPPDGFHTFINERKVAPVIWNGRYYPPGFVFWLNGFMRYSKKTARRDLLRYILPLESFLAIDPISPKFEQLALF